MHTENIGVFGASGYAGIEAARLLARHPGVELSFLAGDRWEGDSAKNRIGLSGTAGSLQYVSAARGLALARECHAVLLATPPEASMELAPALLEAGVQVIDLSGAFRLKNAAAYPVHYGFEHRRPELLAQAVYGLPELSRTGIAGARLIANPGCYATAAALALAPLFAAGVVEGEAIIDAASGVTGAGRKASEEFSFTEVEGDYRAYRVLRHQHAPEIAQTVSRGATAAVPVIFTAHLLPVRRGILATAHARLAPGAGKAAVAAVFADAYAREPFISLAPSADEVSLKHVVGTNRCRLGFSCDEATRRVVVVAAIDNLVKGAAGQAVQNLNLVLGLPETTGLDAGGGFHP